MKKPSIRHISLLVVLVGVLAFAWLVWPSRYRYDRLPMGDSVYSVRTDRLTGKTEVLTISGWVRLGNQKDQTKTGDLPLEKLTALTGTAHLHGSLMELDIYNGTDYEVTEITVQVETFPIETKSYEELKARVSGTSATNDKPKPGGLIADKVQSSSQRPLSSRAYRFTPWYGPCRPLETQQFKADVLDFPPNTNWEWTIKSAKGQKQ